MSLCCVGSFEACYGSAWPRFLFGFALFFATFFWQLHIKGISNVLYFSKSAEWVSIKNSKIVLFKIDKREYQVLYCLWFR